MKSIEDHIEKDKQILDDPQSNPAARRHAKEELHDLEEYAEHHKKEIEEGDLDEEIAESVADAAHNINRVKSKIDRVDDLLNRLRG